MRSASGLSQAEGEVMIVSPLQELQDMSAKLLATARKLPPGPDRQNALEEISNYRLQIAALKDLAETFNTRGRPFKPTAD